MPTGCSPAPPGCRLACRPAWTGCPQRGQHYLHSFAPEQPDLNWRCPAVAEAVLASMAHWLDRGVDGFRLDVFNCYRKAADLADNPRPGNKLTGTDPRRLDLATKRGHGYALQDREDEDKKRSHYQDLHGRLQRMLRR